MSLIFDRVSFTHEGAATPLFVDVSLDCPEGWTGIVGANGTGKTTLLMLALGELEPDRGVVRAPARIAYCPQRTDRATPEMLEFLASLDAAACRLRGVFAVDADWGSRWTTLSHGERKRVQVATALWSDPQALLLDEPTNHIDIDAKQRLLAGLRLFHGVGLLVSHDRDLLDALCRQCAFVDPPSVTVRPGTYTQAALVMKSEEASRKKQHEQASREAARLRRETARRRHDAETADARRSKRRLAPGDADGRARIDQARVLGKDGRAGELARQLAGRVRQAEARREDTRVQKRYELAFHLPGARSPRDRLVSLEAGTLPLGGARLLQHPALSIGRDDRIALVGPNGSGKSTLVQAVVSALTLDEDRFVYLPQEIDRHETAGILDEFRSLSRERQGQVLTVVSGLGSRPPRLLESRDASPGEIRKVLLGLGVINEPYLIVMDEPTNHLDLAAITCLEEALDGCPAALLLVSHDMRFLRRLARTQWLLTPQDAGAGSRLEVRLEPPGETKAVR